jgi:hypothetical protein
MVCPFSYPSFHSVHPYLLSFLPSLLFLLTPLLLPHFYIFSLSPPTPSPPLPLPPTPPSQVFLAQVGLDKPFTGGIGSYKLYVMVAFLLQQQKTQIEAMSSTSTTSTSSVNKKINGNDTKDNSDKFEKENKEEIKLNNLESSVAKVQSPDLGYLLVAFFHHFGNPYNLNSHTIVKVRLQAYIPPHTAASHQSKYYYYL